MVKVDCNRSRHGANAGDVCGSNGLKRALSGYFQASRSLHGKLTSKGAPMIDALQVSCVMLVAFAMVPGVAHALEFPGKRRLDKDAPFAVQPIHYSGFTVAGIGEPVAIIATIASAG